MRAFFRSAGARKRGALRAADCLGLIAHPLSFVTHVVSDEEHPSRPEKTRQFVALLARNVLCGEWSGAPEAHRILDLLVT